MQGQGGALYLTLPTEASETSPKHSHGAAGCTWRESSFRLNGAASGGAVYVSASGVAAVTNGINCINNTFTGNDAYDQVIGLLGEMYNQFGKVPTCVL
jgi:hypothetical protein